MSNKIALTETGGSKRDEQATNDKSSTSIQPSTASRLESKPPPVFVRPVRPNLRRHVLVPGATVAESHQVVGGVPAGAPIELSRVLVAPPKRPAHLPARYDGTFGRHATPMVASAAGSPNKPNRYSWAQMQHWQAQAAAAAANSPSGDHHHGFHHLSSAASRVLVVNPMQIVNLSKHTKSRLIKFIEAVKRFSEKWFSHVLLLMFLAVYACFGAYIFINFEAASEIHEKKQINIARQNIVTDLLREFDSMKNTRFQNSLTEKLDEFEDMLKKACTNGVIGHSDEPQWTFWGALFYSMTVFTTIGYGHLTPVTFAGRVATMVYAIFGIPILLMVLADLGKLLTRIIKYSFKKFRYLYHKLMGRKASLKTRKLISENTNQYIGVAREALERGYATYIQPYNRIPHSLRASSLRRKMHLGSRPADNKEVLDIPKAVDEQQESNTEDQPREQQKVSDIIVTPGKQTKPVSPQPGDKRTLADANTSHSHKQSIGAQRKRKNSTVNLMAANKVKQASGKTSVSRSSSSSLTVQQTKDVKTEKAAEQATASGEQVAAEECKSSSEQLQELDGQQQLVTDYDDEEDEEIVDEFDIPVSFALFLLVTYMMFGAVVFSIWEGWNFFDSLYFVFISMSTIGFGDLVPQHPKRMIGTFIYLLFGLALTSMCINVVQEKIHATFLRAKMQIGEKMGFDLEQIMADDYYDGSMTMDGDEEDVHSVTGVSQANSSSAHLADHMGGSLDSNHHYQPHHHSHYSHHHQGGSAKASPTEVSNPEAAKLLGANKKDSLKQNKKRNVTGLPGHSGHCGSLRRKSSKRNTGGRQASSQNDSAQPISHQQQVPSQPTPITAQLEPLRSPVDIQCSQAGPCANLPVISSPVQALCEPLQAVRKPDQRGYTKDRLLSPQRHLTGMVKSASSDVATARPYGARGSEARSESPSRRASVSQELNQLDDLIVALSKSPSERFGPLLGIPSSGRSSRSNSGSGTNPNQNRRLTSMSMRPSSTSPRPPLAKKSSLTSSIVPQQGNHDYSKDDESSRKALEELESLRFSAV